MGFVTTETLLAADNLDKCNQVAFHQCILWLYQMAVFVFHIKRAGIMLVTAISWMLDPFTAQAEMR